jgi:hypothetical protein
VIFFFDVRVAVWGRYLKGVRIVTTWLLLVADDVHVYLYIGCSPCVCLQLGEHVVCHVCRNFGRDP